MIKSKIWLPTGEVVTVDLEEDYRILPNFKVWEIANNKAEEEIKLEIPDQRAWKLLKMLQITRDRFGWMDLNSVYRTASYNASLTGADPKSCHLMCWAFDWSRPEMTDLDRKEVADWWRDLCREFGEIGAINYYIWGVHCEIGSDVRYGQKEFTIRDFRW